MNKEGELLKYKCDWPKCGYEFERRVRTAPGVSDDKRTGKHNRVSTNIVCPACGNGLKTWGGK